MRIRSIKPEFWRSEDINTLGLEDRLLFIGLWSYVDDNGVGLDRLAAITADLFAGDLERDPPETFARVSRGLLHLFAAGLIARYEVDGRSFLAVTGWKKHQRVDRPNKPRFPAPDQAIAENSRDTRDSLATSSRLEQRNRGAGEQGSRGTGEKGSRGAEEQGTRGAGDQHSSPAPSDDEFAEFWSLYPRKVGKNDARRAFQSATGRADPQLILDAVRRYATDPNLPEMRFVPNPATWLNGARWDDEPQPIRTSPQELSAFEKNTQMANKYREAEAAESAPHWPASMEQIALPAASGDRSAFDGGPAWPSSVPREDTR